MCHSFAAYAVGCLTKGKSLEERQSEPKVEILSAGAGVETTHDFVVVGRGDHATEDLSTWDPSTVIVDLWCVA